MLAAAAACSRRAPALARAGSTIPVRLLQDVEGVGYAGEEAWVKRGYMRNRLYPGRQAAYVSARAAAALKRAGSSSSESQARRERAALVRRLEQRPLRFKRRTDKDGRTFATPIDATQVAQRLLQMNVVGVHPRMVQMQQGDIKTVGRHGVKVSGACLGSSSSDDDLSLAEEELSLVVEVERR